MIILINWLIEEETHEGKNTRAHESHNRAMPAVRGAHMGLWAS